MENKIRNREKTDKEYSISLNKDDLYWIQTLLYDYIESSESNFHQKISVLNTLIKTIKVKNCHMYLENKDIKLIDSLGKQDGK